MRLATAPPMVPVEKAGVMKVRAGHIYMFRALGWDILDRTPRTPADGTIVRVCRPQGCPPPNTLNHCFVETLEGKFIGLVSTASLTPIDDNVIPIKQERK